MRILKIAALTALTIIIVLAVGVTVLLFTLDPNDHKDRIAGLVRDQTGLELQLTGPVELTLYPWLGLTVSNASLGVPQETSFLQVDHARARARLLPLLSGRYEIDTVQIHGADIDLRIDGQGRGNWLPAGVEPVTATDGAPATPRWPAALALGGVDIRDAQLTIDDRVQDRRIVLDDLAIQTSELLFGEPVEFSLSVDASTSRPELRAVTSLEGLVTYSGDGRQYDISPLTLNAILSGPTVPDGESTIRLSAPARLDLDADTLTLESLAMSGPGISLDADISVRELSSNRPGGTLDLDLQGEDMAVLFRIFGQDDLADRMDTLDDRSFFVTADIETDSNTRTLGIHDLQAELLGARIESTLAMEGTALLNGRLMAEGPDLPLLMALAGRLQGGDAMLSGLGQQLGVLPERSFMVRAGFDIDTDNGRIDIPDVSIRALGMQLDGNLAASALQSGSSEVDGSLEIAGNDLSPLLRATGQADLAGVLQSFTLSSRLSGQGGDLTAGPMDLQVSLSDPSLPDGSLALRLQTRAEFSRGDDRLDLPYFTLSGAGLDIDGQLDLTGLEAGDPQFLGQLYVGDTDLRALATQLGLELPPMQDENTLRQFGFQVEFDGTPQQFSTRSLQLTLDESNLTGALQVDRSTTPVRIELDLDLDRMDIDRYLTASTAPAEQAQDGPPAALLPLALFQAADVQGSLRAGQLVVAGTRMDELRIAFSGEDGRVSLAPVETLLYGGRLEGSLRAALMENNELEIDADVDLTSVNLGPLLEDLSDASSLSGLANLQLAVSSRGDSVDTLRARLDGDGELDVEDGILYGVDIGSTLAQVETMIRSGRLMSLDRGSSTAFDEVSATLVIREGIVRSDDLRLLAPGFRVDGRGILLDLNDDTLDYDLETRVDRATATRGEEEYDIGGYTVPIACSGSVDSPSCTPDTEAIVRQALGNEIERRVGDFLERLSR